MNRFHQNTFGQYCAYNQFGNNISKINFLNNCVFNTFGNGCSVVRFGSSCNYNTFANDCTTITFGKSTDLISYVNKCSFGNGCRGLRLINTEQADAGALVQNVTVSAGIEYGTIQELQVYRNAAPMIFEAANTTHIILD